MKTCTNPRHLTRQLVAVVMLPGFFLTLQQAQGAALTGIASTKHNLGGPNLTNVNYVTDVRANNEICVFCHTPHGSHTAEAAPLWNKALSSGSVYITYGNLNSSTIYGVIGKPGAVSQACLSCHDGAQAMDNIINAPGSGSYNATGGGISGRGWTWLGANQKEGKMINTGSSISMLGTNLSNDHPIGVEYCGGPVGNMIGTCKNSDFILPKAEGGKMSTGPWWVDTDDGAYGARQKSDIILFPARSIYTSGIGPQVECASCHDPHSTNALFLRRKTGNTGSITCLSCHVK